MPRPVAMNWRRRRTNESGIREQHCRSSDPFQRLKSTASRSHKCLSPNRFAFLLLLYVVLVFLSLLCCPPVQCLLIPSGINDQRDPDDAPISLLLDGLGEDQDSTPSDQIKLSTTTTTTAFPLLNSTLLDAGDNLTAATISSLLPNPATTDSDESIKTEWISFISNILASTIIFVIGFIGNSVVILVILKFTKVQTVTDIYILNLAVADIMFVSGLVFLVTTLMLGGWIFGNIMCKIYMALTSLNQFASSLLLVVMSFDRFLAVCHPIYAQRFRQLPRTWTICLCIWFACLILMTPILTYAKYDPTKNDTCTIYWPNSYCEVAYAIYSFILGFAAPLSLIAVFYACVIKKLRSAASGTNLISARRSRNRENSNKRVEHLVIGIICTYTICWLPYWIMQIIVCFAEQNEQPLANHWWFVLLASNLSYANSSLNPILYAFLSGNFMRRCNDIVNTLCSLRCLWFRKRDRLERNSTGNLNNATNNTSNKDSSRKQPQTSLAKSNETETSFRPDSQAQTSSQRLLNNEQTARLIPSPTGDSNNRLQSTDDCELDLDGTVSHSSEYLDPNLAVTKKKCIAFIADQNNEVKFSHSSNPECSCEEV